MADCSEAKSAKRSFASNYLQIEFLTRSFASLRLTNLSEILVDNFLAILPAGVNSCGKFVSPDKLKIEHARQSIAAF